MENNLFLIPLLSFLGFLLNGLLGRHLPRPAVTLIACAGPAVGAVLSAVALGEVAADPSRVLTWSGWDWMRVGDALLVPFAFAFDRLTGVMTLVVTGVGSLIHIYSAGYMREDPGYARYFAYLNLFMAAMLVLVLADNIVLLFLGWEGVGLCSYLLIGFWYKDRSNCEAGIKAFVVNRIGDFGFLLGILLIFVTFESPAPGGKSVFEFAALRSLAATPGNDSALSWIALLLFIGATGKSAQIPLHVWLPDAMAGPTPVSALIHAATMVTSGVYMVARLEPLYEAVPGLRLLIAVIGATTALLAAFIALTQTDIKKVLAYSTVSQLGYMFLALGMGAYGVAVFHLVTHAFFKGLLFLGAGSVIHILHHEQDMRRMGGLFRKAPLTSTVFIAGALALAGFPLTSGFFSKDAIVHGAMTRAFHGGIHLGWLVLWLLAFTTAILTAFYIFRQVFLVFFGEYRGGASAQGSQKGEGEAHAAGHGGGHGARGSEVHEAPPVMTVPLLLLAVLALGGGFLPVPDFLAPPSAAAAGHGHDGEILGWVLGGAASVAGIAAAFVLFVKRPDLRRRLVEDHAFGRAAARLSRNKLYVDELYDLIVVRPLSFASQILFYLVDRALIDWLMVAGTAHLVRAFGGLLRRLQSGRIPAYVVWFILGSIGILYAVLRYL
jgi:NADH-quinone oxidoreductase subunit L